MNAKSMASLPQFEPLDREKVIVDDLVLHIEHPRDSGRWPDRSVAPGDPSIPYWTEIWPASRMLAKVVRRESWTPGATALEIGCGLGLPGIVALAMGLKVTFSDYDTSALAFAAQNARLNGFTEFACRQLDWRSPPEDLRPTVILAADIVYEISQLPPITACIKKLLPPDGFCLLTDLDRLPTGALARALEEEGLKFSTAIVRAGEPSGRRLKGTLYRITR